MLALASAARGADAVLTGESVVESFSTVLRTLRGPDGHQVLAAKLVSYLPYTLRAPRLIEKYPPDQMLMFTAFWAKRPAYADQLKLLG